MEEPVATPKIPGPLFRAESVQVNRDQLLSSSPGFGTPAYPIANRPPGIRQPFAPQLNTTTTTPTPTVLPILLPPQTLRPVAFRTLTKKHNLTLTSSGLGLLSTFIGKFCGSGWREEGLAERVLDEIARTWKRTGGGILVEDGPEKKLSSILKSLEPCMSGGRLDPGKLSRSNSAAGGLNLSRSTSLETRSAFGDDGPQLAVSALDRTENTESGQEKDDHMYQDVRSYLKVVSAFHQPRLIYSTTKKTLESVSSTPSLLPPIQHKVSMFRNRYHLVHQRLLRNESFQAPSFSTATRPPSLMHSGSSGATVQQAYKITPISNLLGRSGTSHLLLGMLVNSPAGDLALADLSGSVVLDLSAARPVPEDGAWYCPGMMVLIEGIYEEDGSNNSNLGGAGGVGGQIKGKFLAETMAGPPPERREVTIGTGHAVKSDDARTSIGAGQGWVDFLGVGSENAVGSQMRRIQRRLWGRGDSDHDERKQSKVVMIGECHLDNPRTLEALRAILASYTVSGEMDEQPLSIVLMGNFVSAASMAGSTKGGGSVEYKEYFDALASVLSEFPTLLSSTTFVFVPGDGDPWSSSFSAGAAVVLPRQAIPELFTSRIRRAIANANTASGKKETDCAGEAIWASNPARMSLFGPVEEIVLFRDDISGRLRRNAVVFPNLQDDGEGGGEQQPHGSAQPESMDLDEAVKEATSHQPTATPVSKINTNATTAAATARKLVKTILDQGHLAPFPLSIRPVFWDYASSLNLYPLPTALVLADAETPAFAVTYEGCHVMNPGRVLGDLGAKKGIAKWMEFDALTRRGVVRETRF